MNAWQAFRTGLDRTARYWQVWLILYAVNLLTALLLLFLPALSLVSGPGHRPAIRQAADGLDAWFVVETLMSPDTMVALGQGGPEPGLTPALQQAILVGLITVAALPWLTWLPASLLSGGLLLAYAEAPQPFDWRRFLWGCWHWFGVFLILGAVQAFALVLVIGAAVALALVIGGAFGAWLTWLVLLGLALVAALWLLLLEFTRVLAVVEGTRNLFRAFGRAMCFVLRHPLQVATLYGLVLLLAGLLHLLYRLLLMPALPLDWWPLVLLVQQSFIVARLGVRMVRLAGGVALVGQSSPTEVGGASPNQATAQPI